MVKTFASFPPDSNGAEIGESAAWRRADIGGANGHGNARALARALSPISLGGTANGVQLLSPDTVEMIFEEQSNGIGPGAHDPLRFGIGYRIPLSGKQFPRCPTGRFASGAAGAARWQMMDPDRRATITYVMNKMGPGTEGSKRTARYLTLIYEALG